MLTARRSLLERTLGDLLAQAGRARATGEVRVVERDLREHVVLLRDGVVVAARVAGRFDPLLSRLRDAGALDDDGFVRVLEALAGSERRSGDLAVEHAGVPFAAVRTALAAQARERLAAVHAQAALRGKDARLVERELRTAEPSVRLAWRDAVAGAPRARDLRPLPSPRAAPPRPSRDDSRRALRRLARELHPDLHAHLPAAERDALAARFARATAAHHALG